MKAFEVLRRGGNPGKPIRLRRVANERLVERVQAAKGKGFEYKRRGATWKSAATAQAFREALADVRLQTGDAIYCRRTKSTTVFVLRAIEVLEPITIPPIPDPNATVGVKAIWKAMWEEIPGVERELGYQVSFVYQGIYNCRRISGSSTWSQHAWRNAIDGHLNRREFQALDGRANDILIARLKRRDVAAEYLWRVSGHYGHWHLTAKPKRYGTPPCA